jgi:hypothetical protein
VFTVSVRAEVPNEWVYVCPQREAMQKPGKITKPAPRTDRLEVSRGNYCAVIESVLDRRAPVSELREPSPPVLELDAQS